MTQKSFEKIEKLIAKHPNLFKKLKKLNLAYNSIANIEFLLPKMLGNEIEEINISGIALQTQRFSETLSPFEKLQILKLKECGLSNFIFNKKMSNLKELDLSRNRMNFWSFSENLIFFPNLEKTNFSFNTPELHLNPELKFQIFDSKNSFLNQNYNTFDNEIRSLRKIKLKGLKEFLNERRENKPKSFLFLNHAEEVDVSFCDQGFLEFFLNSMLENCIQSKIDGVECYKNFSTLKMKNEGVKKMNESLFRVLTRVLSFIEGLKHFDLEGWDLNYDQLQTLKNIVMDKNKLKNQ